MCLSCWDCDKKEKMDAQFGCAACPGDDILTMSKADLEKALTVEWILYGKQNFRVFKRAIVDAHENNLSWSASHPTRNGGASTQLSVELV